MNSSESHLINKSKISPNSQSEEWSTVSHKRRKRTLALVVGAFCTLFLANSPYDHARPPLLQEEMKSKDLEQVLNMDWAEGAYRTIMVNITRKNYK